MYKIRTNREENTILIPATLDSHFPLIRYMFWSKGYRVVPLRDKDEFAVREEGLKYANHDICYPFILMTGQVVKALRSGRYDPKKTFILMPTAGDACRGACYIGLMQRSLHRAHFDDTKVMTINVRHVCDEISLKISLGTAIRGLFGMYYGDMLMLLANQTRPYEVRKGETDRLFRKWTRRVASDIRLAKHLTLRSMKKNFERMAQDFKKIERTGEKKKVVGIVAEFYEKYCALGNWDIVKFLEDNGCEAHVNGLSWYMLYYVDSHKPDKLNPERIAFEAAKKLMIHVQDSMIETMRRNGFHCLSRYETMDVNSRKLVTHNLTVGDGWLLGAEAVDYCRHGINRILCIAPFGCMANVCAGRGVYPRIRRAYPKASLVVVEPDSSGSKLNYYNRVRMLIDQM
ncbi:MAG: hypothetical protein J5845_04800 [Lachnospiraceae bacterium]|nr:hypothetical protein [Lachnospiraceae bacterium]